MEVRNEQKTEKDLQRPVQYRFLVQGEIDAICLRAAWQRLAKKCWGGPRPSAHGNGHSNGTGNGAGSGKQAPWQEHDLRGLTSEAVQQWITSFLETDQQQEISAQRFPAMRGALLLTEERKAEMLWSLHPTPSERLNLREAVQDFVMDSLGQVRVTEIPAPVERMKWSQELRQARTSQPAVAPAAMNAPADRAEEELIAIWEAVLNRNQINATDDFFELGGHSLLAARLMARIEDEMGLELPLASLLEAPTVRGQAQLVRKYRGEKNAGAHAARPHGAVRQLPFFFLGGDPTFRPLSQKLSELHEFHSLGLQMSVLEKLSDRSMESIAREFVRSIRERCPEGPYLLSGWCAHGLLAYEVAQQLQAQGQEVAEVLLLEAVNPVRMHQYSGWKRTIARMQLKWHLLKFEYSYVKQLDSMRARDYVGGRVRQKVARMKQSLRRIFKNGPGPELQDTTTGNPLDILYAAAAKYEPKPYRGRVVLIRSTQRTFGFGHVLDLGWTPVLGENLEICETPGNHYSIYMQPNVDALALKMQGCLLKAEEQTRVAAAGVRR